MGERPGPVPRKPAHPPAWERGHPTTFMRPGPVPREAPSSPRPGKWVIPPPSCPLGSVAQSCLTLCDPMDCRLPGSSVHEILQARTLEWAAVPFSSRSSRPRDRAQASCFADGFFTV